VAKGDVTGSVANDASGVALGELTVLYDPQTFPTGDKVSFGIDRDSAATNNGGNSADLLAGSPVVARFIAPDGTKVKVTGTIENKTGKGYSPDVGYGLINVYAALLALQAGQ
jgi:hypothetical protein